jgi:hypothetical protein
MPVEIRELVIRAITTSESGSSDQPPECEMTPEEIDAIIQECVRQVLKILQKKKER